MTIAAKLSHKTSVSISRCPIPKPWLIPQGGQMPFNRWYGQQNRFDNCPQADFPKVRTRLDYSNRIGNLSCSSCLGGHSGGTVNLCFLTDVGLTGVPQQLSSLDWQVSSWCPFVGKYNNSPFFHRGSSLSLIPTMLLVENNKSSRQHKTLAQAYHFGFGFFFSPPFPPRCNYFTSAVHFKGFLLHFIQNPQVFVVGSF